MSQEVTPNLKLPLLIPNQSGKEYTHNEALIIIDAILNGGVLDLNVNTPPAVPENGASYLVGPEPNGVFSEHNNELAYYYNGWRFIKMKHGATLWIDQQQQLYTLQNDTWVPAANANSTEGNTPQSLPTLGINATADDNNRLTTRSDYILFNHETADARVKINKASPEATASHLFQTNYGSRAEFGLLGDDNFTIKTSPDGSNWYEGLIIHSNGGIDIKQSVNYNGIALSAIGMPGDRKIDLSIASENNYIAPADGYIVISFTSTSSNQMVALNNYNHNINSAVSTASGQFLGATVACKANDMVKCIYNIKPSEFFFVYAKGSQQE